MRYLSIKNLKKHQHYKDRRPPWIKLHAEVLDDYTFTCLQDASKAHLMLLWVLASRMDNRIPYDLAWITQKLGANTPVDLEELILQGFIEVSQDDSTSLAPRKQVAMPETETEAEKKKRPVAAAPVALVPNDRPSPAPAPFSLAPYLDLAIELRGECDPPRGRWGKLFKRLERKHGREEVLRRWGNYLEAKGEWAVRTPEDLATNWPLYADGNAGKRPHWSEDFSGDAAYLLHQPEVVCAGEAP